jgi:hypothetical protein
MQVNVFTIQIHINIFSSTLKQYLTSWHRCLLSLLKFINFVCTYISCYLYTCVCVCVSIFVQIRGVRCRLRFGFTQRVCVHIRVRETWSSIVRVLVQVPYCLCNSGWRSLIVWHTHTHTSKINTSNAHTLVTYTVAKKEEESASLHILLICVCMRASVFIVVEFPLFYLCYYNLDKLELFFFANFVYLKMLCHFCLLKRLFFTKQFVLQSCTEDYCSCVTQIYFNTWDLVVVFTFDRSLNHSTHTQVISLNIYCHHTRAPVVPDGKWFSRI